MCHIDSHDALIAVLTRLNRVWMCPHSMQVAQLTMLWGSSNTKRLLSWQLGIDCEKETSWTE